MFKTIIPLLIIMLVITMLSGCGGTADDIETADDITSTVLIPQRADMIGHMQLNRILADKDLEDLYDGLPKDPGDAETLDEAIDAAADETGIDPRDFDEVFFFADTSSSTGEYSYFGLIVKGTYDESDIINSVEITNEVNLSAFDYKGNEVYADIEKGAALAFLNEETLVVGTVNSVRDVIDIKIGDETPLTGDVIDKYTALGNVLVKAEASISSESMEDAVSQASDYLPIPIDLSALINVETAEMTVDKENKALSLGLKLCFTDNDSAKTVEELIVGMKDIIPLLDFPEEYTGEIPIPEQTQEILSKLLTVLPILDFSETGTGGIPLPEVSMVLLPELLSMLEVEVIEDCLTISLDTTFDEIEGLLSEEG